MATIDDVLKLAYEIKDLETSVGVKRVQLAEMLAHATTPEVKRAVVEMLVQAPKRAGKASKANGDNMTERAKIMLETNPGKRFSVSDIASALGAKPLSVRKIVFRLTHGAAKGIKRDKRQRGMYYFAG